MMRKKLISLVTEETASAEARRAVKAHTAAGQRMTNMKWTMLHNVPLFEVMTQVMEAANGQMQGRTPRRAMIFYLWFKLQQKC